MKKGALHFLSRKNQSLFDTNIKIQELENVELVLDSSAIPESGTAKVRSRPTVKHYSSTSDIVQGFAVPTPKVPLLPPINGLKTNGKVSRDQLFNGSLMSVPDPVEGEILVPPPPSVAPPPPPTQFILPPADFIGDLDTAGLTALQPPSMHPSNPPSLAPPQKEEDFTLLKPPSMLPPKPPSTSSLSSTSSSHISSPPPTTIPDLSECPKFAPPQPPMMREHKPQKIPPPKPTRLSSIPTFDGPPIDSAPAPPVQNQTPSSFNPQNTAKLYNIPKTSILAGQVNYEKKPKQILLLEDSRSGNSVPVPVQINGQAASVVPPSVVLPSVVPPSVVPPSVVPPSVVPPSKPVRKNSGGTQLEKDLQQLKENLQTNTPSKTTETVSTPQEISTPAPTLPKDLQKLQKAPVAPVQTEAGQVKLEDSPGHTRRFSPLIDRKLRNLKNSEPPPAREGPAASPLALLMAAKEREKHRSSLSRENSTKVDKPTATIQPSESSRNSFVVIPTPSSSLNSQATTQEQLKPQPPDNPKAAALVKEETSPTNPPVSVPSTGTSPPASLPTAQKKSVAQVCVQDEENGENLCMPLLPPPPEFANFEDFSEDVEGPPAFPPPDPPTKKAPPPPTAPTAAKPPPTPAKPPPTAPTPAKPLPSAPTPLLPKAPGQAPPPPTAPAPSPPKASAQAKVSPPPPTVSPAPLVHVPPPPPPPPPTELKPPAPPKFPPPNKDIIMKPSPQTKSTALAPQASSPSISASQATLLSILQKKMLEMDHKMAPMKESEPSSDDWGSPMSDEETKVPVLPKANAKKFSTLPVKTGGLDMRELENKVAKKNEDMGSSKGSTRNGPQSKHQYGMTFTVRPGTKNPITLVNKGDSS